MLEHLRSWGYQNSEFLKVTSILQAYDMLAGCLFRALPQETERLNILVKLSQ